jgi:hypothetical protein
MSFAVVQNGQIRQVLQMDVPFTIGEKQYSSAFLRNSTPQEKLEAGVWEIIEGVRPDDRFYWVSGASYHINEVNSTVEASYPATAKELEDVTVTPEGAEESVTTKGLKSNFIAQIKAAAGSALAATDWMVIRKIERDVAIPADVVADRAQIVADCAAKEAAIAAATDIDSLIAALQG